MSEEKPMGYVIQIDEARIRDHLGEMVRGTVEETLNAMLDAEAEQRFGAGRYERSQARQDTRAGIPPFPVRRPRTPWFPFGRRPARCIASW
jgi:putative transposase